MPDEPHLNDPKDVVLAFAAGYNEWEADMQADKDSYKNRSLKKRKRDLLATYCTIKKRAHVDGDYDTCDPPAYATVVDKNIANVEEVTRTRMHVDTKYRNYKAYRFIVLKKKDGWRIDDVKWKIRKTSDWAATVLGK